MTTVQKPKPTTVDEFLAIEGNKITRLETIKDKFSKGSPFSRYSYHETGRGRGQETYHERTQSLKTMLRKK
jgi:hypothetical protein